MRAIPRALFRGKDFLRNIRHTKASHAESRLSAAPKQAAFLYGAQSLPFMRGLLRQGLLNLFITPVSQLHEALPGMQFLYGDGHVETGQPAW